MKLPTVALLLALCACVHLPHMEPAQRSPSQAFAAAALVEVDCGSEEPWSPHPEDWVSYRWGSAVAVSERHLVTAYHVASCPAIPTVHVKLSSGRIVRAFVTDEDPDHDWARLEIASADNFDLGIAPPALAAQYPGTKACAVVPRLPTPVLDCGMQVGGGEVDHMDTRPGDSGAGVYDMDGGLLGVVTRGNGADAWFAPASADWLQGT